MIRRLASLLLLIWAFGFVWFAVTQPGPAGTRRVDAVIVLTGGSGRIAYALDVMKQGKARRMFVSGVDKNVKPHEFALEYQVDTAQMACCVTLGFDAVDTESNAREVARWLAREKVRTLRLVTNDWHMRRSVFELEQVAPADVTIYPDAVPSQPSLQTLFFEYHKLLARRLARLIA